MVKSCCVVTCRHKMEKGKKSFFRVPSSASGYLKGQKLVCYERRRSVWLSRIFKNAVSSKIAKELWVCADHFLLGRPSPLMDTDHPDWAPNQNIDEPTVAEEAAQKLDAIHRGVKMTFCIPASTSTETVDNTPVANIKDAISVRANVDKRDLIDVTHVTKPSGVAGDIFIVSAMSKLDRSVATQTFSTYRDVGIQKGVQNKPVSVQTDLRCFDMDQNDMVIEKLQKRVDSLEVNEEFLKHDPEAVKFYTAMPSFEVLMLMFNLISNCIPQTSRSTLTKFQQVILTIMKLRHNFHFIDLAHRFGISRQTGSRVFHTIIGIMHRELQGNVFWPDRETFRSNLPMCFDQSFGRAVTVVIDCFKVTVEKPTKAITGETAGLKHQTLKYLVGITLQGLICHVSKGFEGESSAQFATEKSWFLKHLQPGDVIMADRDNLPDDMVGFYYAKVNLRNDFEPMRNAEIERIPKIANIRGHVERVVKSVRKRYALINNVVNGFTLESGGFDEVVSVCCSLNNFCITHKTDLRDKSKPSQEALV